MEYLADTVSIIYHLGKRSRLGTDVDLIFQQADQGEHKVFISAITLMEVLYLSDIIL
jgi:predicted nucleic acid-binding protein